MEGQGGLLSGIIAGVIALAIVLTLCLVGTILLYGSQVIGR